MARAKARAARSSRDSASPVRGLRWQNLRWRIAPHGPARWMAARLAGHVQPGDLAEPVAETHLLDMQATSKPQVVGFMELQVGSRAVQVPIRTAEPAESLPLASFEVEGNDCAILIRGDSSSKAVERAMGDAAKQAMVHLSRKLLN